MNKKRGSYDASLWKSTDIEKKYLYLQMKKQGFSDEQINFELAQLDSVVINNHSKFENEEQQKDFKEEFERLTRTKRKKIYK